MIVRRHTRTLAHSVRTYGRADKGGMGPRDEVGGECKVYTGSRGR